MISMVSQRASVCLFHVLVRLDVFSIRFSELTLSCRVCVFVCTFLFSPLFPSVLSGGVNDLIRNSAIIVAVIFVVSLIVSFSVTRCISRPLLSVVDFMSKAVSVIRMERGQGQRAALQELCESWSASSGMILPPLNNNSNAAQQHAAAMQAATVPALPSVPLYKSFCWLCTKEGDTCCCYRVGRSLREVQLMHAAFSSMLYTLASYDQLDAINQAKRQFIRYIFHVRRRVTHNGQTSH
jgi:hypothetical protein